MKKRHSARLGALAFGLFALFVSACGGSSAPATVNGVDIDHDEYTEEISVRQRLTPAGGPEEATAVPKDLAAEVLTNRIYLHLIHREIERLGVTVTAEEYKATADELKAQVDSDPVVSELKIPQRFLDYLSRGEAESAALQKRIEDPAKPWFTDADVKTYYDKVKSTRFVAFCTHHVLVADEATANLVLAEVKGSAGFESVAKARSTDTGSAASGGDIGCTPKGQLVPAYENAVLAAKQGDIIGPIKSDFGYHVIRVDKAYGEQPLDDQLRTQITANLASYQGYVEWLGVTSNVKVDRKYGTWNPTAGRVEAISSTPTPTTLAK